MAFEEAAAKGKAAGTSLGARDSQAVASASAEYETSQATADAFPWPQSMTWDWLTLPLTEGRHLRGWDSLLARNSVGFTNKEHCF